MANKRLNRIKLQIITNIMKYIHALLLVFTIVMYIISFQLSPTNSLKLVSSDAPMVLKWSRSVPGIESMKIWRLRTENVYIMQNRNRAYLYMPFNVCFIDFKISENNLNLKILNCLSIL